MTNLKQVGITNWKHIDILTSVTPCCRQGGGIHRVPVGWVPVRPHRKSTRIPPWVEMQIPVGRLSVRPRRKSTRIPPWVEIHIPVGRLLVRPRRRCTRIPPWVEIHIRSVCRTNAGLTDSNVEELRYRWCGLIKRRLSYEDSVYASQIYLQTAAAAAVAVRCRAKRNHFRLVRAKATFSLLFARAHYE